MKKTSSQYIDDIERIMYEAKYYLPSYAFTALLDGVRFMIEEFEEDIDDDG